MTTESKSELSWQRLARELALIEGIAQRAISPTEVLSPEALAKKASEQKKLAKKASGRKKKARVADGPPSTEFEREEKLFKASIAEMEASIGTTLVPSSREELIHAFETFRPAFDAIIEVFQDRKRGVVYDDRSKIYDSLHDLMQATFRIGAQATISTRAESFVRPNVKRAGTSGARAKREKQVRDKHESIEEKERLNRLDKAICATVDESLAGKLRLSNEFAGRIFDEVRKRLGIKREETQPTQGEIRDRVRAIHEARRSRIQQTE